MRWYKISQCHGRIADLSKNEEKKPFFSQIFVSVRTRDKT
jgi:hypothetical protein